MNKENVKKWKGKNKKAKSVTIRVTKDLSAWLNKNDYSPTGIFMEAVKDLGYKTK